MGAVAGQVWGVIPARGGSKAIPLKNLAPLQGRPLIEYVIRAAQGSRTITRIICSTDHEAIAAVCQQHGVEVHQRPAELSGDDVPVLDVLTHLVGDLGAGKGTAPEAICLLQPSSPFVLPEQVDEALEKLRAHPEADSVQTISRFHHNFHAYNQRIIEEGVVRFRFPEERRRCYNKQRKPSHYAFGNLIVVRASVLRDQRDLYGRQSLPLLIPTSYAVEIDEPEDLLWAEWLLVSRRVVLSHVGRAMGAPVSRHPGWDRAIVRQP